jgi:hypothetical protein
MRKQYLAVDRFFANKYARPKHEEGKRKIFHKTPEV